MLPGIGPEKYAGAQAQGEVIVEGMAFLAEVFAVGEGVPAPVHRIEDQSEIGFVNFNPAFGNGFDVHGSNYLVQFEVGDQTGWVIRVLRDADRLRIYGVPNPTEKLRGFARFDDDHVISIGTPMGFG
jgi:hypothetical protein